MLYRAYDDKNKSCILTHLETCLNRMDSVWEMVSGHTDRISPEKMMRSALGHDESSGMVSSKSGLLKLSDLMRL